MKKILIILSTLGSTSCGDTSSVKDANVLLVNSFETLDGWLPEEQNRTLTYDKAHSGKVALKVDEANEYSLTYSNSLRHLRREPITKLKISAWVLLPNRQTSASLVTTINDSAALDGKPVVWEAIELNKAVGSYGKWVEVSKVIELPSSISPSHKLSVYLWRTGSNMPAYVDDIKISIEP